MQQLNSPEYSSFLPYSFKRFFKRRLKEILGFLKLEPASRGMVGVEADQNELSFAQNSKIELQISAG